MERRANRVLFGRAKSNMRAHQDQRGSRCLGARSLQRRFDRGDVVAIVNVNGVPAICRKALGAVFGKSDVGSRCQ
jgi:hypothetical protein